MIRFFIFFAIFFSIQTSQLSNFHLKLTKIFAPQSRTLINQQIDLPFSFFSSNDLNLYLKLVKAV